VIKEALEFLSKLQTPKNLVSVELHGQPYSVKADGTVGDLIPKPNLKHSGPVMQVSTLCAVVDAFKAKLDGLEQASVAVHVADPFNVRVLDLAADEFGNRHIYIAAVHKAETPFQFGVFLTPERFLIDFRASFLFNEEATKVQQLCSTVESGATVSVADDGISQQVVASSGTVTKASVTLPAEGIPLIPWRTFRDAAAVESKFLLRMKASKEGVPSVALFEIDEKWKLDTVNAIRRYFEKHLPGANIIA
jgi:hypothetical protein